MYRGKDIGSKDELIETCHRLLLKGDSETLFSILPHISLLRCRSFLKLLSRLLGSRVRSKQIFAAMALGAVACPEGLIPLTDRFDEPSTLTGRGSCSLQTAIIVAIGEIGSEQGVAALQKIFAYQEAGDGFTRKRRRVVVSALGKLLQQDVQAGREALQEMLKDEEPGVRAQAALELGTGYWHIPDKVPEEVLEALINSSQDASVEVRMAAFSAIYGLAEVGCSRALELLDS